jgi:glycosyltransferase involved in cell wall biosynthesis
MLMVLLFWGSVLFVIYTYAGYAVVLAVVRRVRRRAVLKAPITPRVSFIIAAHNEARRIAEKIENTLSQDYPKERFDVIVASDYSTDGTDAIVSSYASRGVRLVRAPERGGKERAQRLAVDAASGEVLVFSDAATHLDRDGVRRIVMSFNDPSVGCVSSVDRMLDGEGRPTGESAYVRYEMGLRALESEAGSLVGLSGSFFAARRAVCQSWPVDTPSDFGTVLNAVTIGLRGVSDPDAVGYYRDLADARKEYARKVRTVARGVSGLLRHKALLNPFRYGFFAWQLASHKLFRWMVPFAILGAGVSSVALASDSMFFRGVVALQALCYALAIMALKWHTSALRVWRPVGFLLLANVSILDAWLQLARGQQVTMWTPSER